MLPDRFAGFQLRSACGVPVLFDEDRRFKTMRVLVYARRPLGSPATVAARCILPSLLLHGTARDQGRPAIARRMEELYGAVVVPSVSKVGECQVLRMSLDGVAGAFLPGHPPQLEDGLEFLGDLITSPRLQGDGFPEPIFQRERRQALDAVRTRIDDRGSFARDEALRLACVGEPHAILEFGGEAELRNLTRRDPESARQDLLERAETFVVARGAFDADELARAIDGFRARLPARREEKGLPPVTVPPRAPPRHV